MEILCKNEVGSFNSRTLGGVRLTSPPSSAVRRKVSIHAPWEGCDWRWIWLRQAPRSFNSRTLGGVRQCGAKLRIMGRINKRNLRLGVLS